MQKGLIVGNWKMNGGLASVGDLRVIASGCNDYITNSLEVVICPPATLLAIFSSFLKGYSGLKVGAQDCHMESGGSYTGDISANILADVGASYVIIGHSERRIGHKETGFEISAKVMAAWSAGLIAIVCIGEDMEQYALGKTFSVITDQLNAFLPAEIRAELLVIAYEPIWAIGTGVTPSLQSISSVVEHVRAHLLNSYGHVATVIEVPILYGGSINVKNSTSIFALPNVNGGLIGGASLVPLEFVDIVHNYASCASRTLS